MNLKRKDYMKQHSFTDFVYEVIGELRQENRFATAYIYHYALQAFTASVGGGKIFWGGLTEEACVNFNIIWRKSRRVITQLLLISVRCVLFITVR